MRIDYLNWKGSWPLEQCKRSKTRFYSPFLAMCPFLLHVYMSCARWQPRRTSAALIPKLFKSCVTIHNGHNVRKWRSSKNHWAGTTILKTRNLQNQCSEPKECVPCFPIAQHSMHCWLYPTVTSPVQVSLKWMPAKLGSLQGDMSRDLYWIEEDECELC